jgi:uncharacterized membrane protein YfcA
MNNRGFQLFVLIFGGIILVVGAFCAFMIDDSSTQSMMIGFAVLYIIYVVLFIRKEKQRRKAEKNDKTKSPLMRR